MPHIKKPDRRHTSLDDSTMNIDDVAHSPTTT